MRNLILSFVVLVTLAAMATRVVGVGAAPGKNLLANSSFEDRSGPRKDYPEEPWGYGPLDTISRSPFAHWGFSGYMDGGDYDVKLGEGHTGQLCARLVCRKKARATICSEIIKVKPGTKLRFRAFFKAIDARGKCNVMFEGDPGEGWAKIDLPRKETYDWTEVTGVVTVKPPMGERKVDADGNTRIIVFIYTRAYGELWMDDISLTAVEE
jgi:hypothetical protein